MNRRVEVSYAGAAPAIEKNSPGLTEPIVRYLCELAELKDGDRVLDIGTGTGPLVRAASRRVAPTGYVAGIDPSEDMLRTGKQTGRPAGAAPLAYCLMDAESLGFKAASFDAVLSTGAVLHFSDIAVAMKEMRRVLKPGGGLVVSFVHSRPIALVPRLKHYGRELALTLLSPVYPTVKAPVDLTRMVRRIQIVSLDDMRPSWIGHDPRHTLVKAMHEAGFRDVKRFWRGHVVYFDSPEEFWEAQAAIDSVIRENLRLLPPETVTELRTEFLRIAQSVLDRGGRLRYPWGAFCIRAKRGD